MGRCELSGHGGSTRIDTLMPWILENVEAVHGTTDFCSINQVYDDGVATSTATVWTPTAWRTPETGTRRRAERIHSPEAAPAPAATLLPPHGHFCCFPSGW